MFVYLNNFLSFIQVLFFAYHVFLSDINALCTSRYYITFVMVNPHFPKQQKTLLDLMSTVEIL